jgi:hypothetical protein
MTEFDRLLGELEASLEGLVASILARLRERFPASIMESAFTAAQLAGFTRASIRVQLAAFRRDALPESCPEVDAAATRAVARVGEFEAFSSGYRTAQKVLWEAWFGLIEDSPQLSAEQRRELLARGSDFFFRYADLLSDYVAEIHRHEGELLRDNGEQRRFRAVKAMLDREPMPVSGLDLDLEQHHLGLLAWGEGASAEPRRLAAELHRPLLIVEPLKDSWWGWISGGKAFGRAEEQVLARFQPAAGRGLALGLQEFGESGFRTTHRQAQRARWLCEPSGTPLARYADVALEALASENLEDAQTFVARELGQLDDDSATSGRIRETLSAYFAAEHNAASAAASLGIHQQTVANRLRAAEERLGHSIGARRVELELALRLRHSLDSHES